MDLSNAVFEGWSFLAYWEAVFCNYDCEQVASCNNICAKGAQFIFTNTCRGLLTKSKKNHIFLQLFQVLVPQLSVWWAMHGHVEGHAKELFSFFNWSIQWLAGIPLNWVQVDLRSALRYFTKLLCQEDPESIWLAHGPLMREVGWLSIWEQEGLFSSFAMPWWKVLTFKLSNDADSSGDSRSSTVWERVRLWEI